MSENTSEFPSEDDIRKIIKSYVTTQGLVRHQIDSYNHFIEVLLPLIVQESSDLSTTSSDGKYSYHVQFTNVVAMPPSTKESSGFEVPLWPDAARHRGQTYSSSIVCDMVHDKYDQTTDPPTHIYRRVYKELVLAKLPVMLGSTLCHLKDPTQRRLECPFDSFGYFIINGTEKTLLGQEKLKVNSVVVFPSKNTKYSHCAETRSCHELKLRSTSTALMYSSHANTAGFIDVHVQLPFLTLMIPLPSLFKLLGCDSREEVIDLVQPESKEILHSLHSIFDNDVQSEWSREDVFTWLGKEGTKETTKERRAKFVTHILANETVPHMALGVDERALKKKAIFFAYKTRRLLRVAHGLDAIDDRDDYSLKRVDASGMLISLLFRQLFRQFLKQTSVAHAKLIEKGTIDTVNLGDVLTQRKITSGIRHAFSTGSWGIQGRGGQTGVAQILTRMSTLSALSNLRRLSCPCSREAKSTRPRLLHSTSYALTCPVETPEGGSCGLIKNLSLLCHVRTRSASTAPIAELILKITEVDITPLLRATREQRRRDICVQINGVFIAYTPNAHAPKLVELIRHRRRTQRLPFDLSVCLQNRNVVITTDPGALLFPAFIASELHRVSALVRNCPPYESLWSLLLKEGCIEYLDKCEELSDMRVALSVSNLARDAKAAEADDQPSQQPRSSLQQPFTHAHIHPSTQLGVCASLIPLCEYNQSPRNTYQSAMGKQAIGVYTTNYNHRLDTVQHVRCQAQRPLVMTMAESFLTNDVPSGENLCVAIMCDMGFNQEDSVIVNQSAIDRGILRSTVYRTYRDEERSTGADAEVFCNIAKAEDGAVTSMRESRFYAKLDDSGIVRIGETLECGDAVIGKTIQTAEIASQSGSRQTIQRCKSSFLKSDEPCVVDAILQTKNKDGAKMCKVRTRAYRKGGIGDKCASRHGQKGVIGMTLKAEDMPFSEDGIQPDLIMNCHAVPSRMTIAHLFEMLYGRVCCEEAMQGDGTAFMGRSVGKTPEEVADTLEKLGFSRYGESRLTCGITGAQHKCLTAIGPVFYQRLKHMVIDKVHARSRGNTTFLTRQPLEGRSRDGGLRIGEMERDCLHEETHQILTSEGFLFLRDIETKLAHGEQIVIGAFDPESDMLVYEPMNQLIVNEAREREWLQIQSAAESVRWTDDGSESPKDGKKSNQLSLMVTPKHIMYTQIGDARVRATNGDEYIRWNGREVCVDGTRKFQYAPFEEITAGEMYAASSSSRFRMRTSPVNGVAMTDDDMQITSELVRQGLCTNETLGDFLELYGFWLGDGTLQFKAGCGTDAVMFTNVKQDDIDWIAQKLALLTPNVSYYSMDAYEKRIVITDASWVEFFHTEYRTKYALGDPELVRPSTTAERKKKPAHLRKPCIGVKGAKWFAPFVWHLCRDDARLILRGLRRADGCWTTSVDKIYTSSVKFRDQIVRLCIHAGYAPRFLRTYPAGTVRGTSRNGREIIASVDGWQVTFADTDKRNAYSYPVVKHSDMKRVTACCRSWCVVVNHGFIITRRALADAVSGVVTQASVPIVVHNCMISHGATSVMVDRLMESSDMFAITVCKTCGLMCEPGIEDSVLGTQEPYCRICGDACEGVVQKNVPYAYKLLQQELLQMHIKPAMRFMKS